MSSYTEIIFFSYKNNAPLTNVTGKYVTTIGDDRVVFTIRNLSVADADNYTIEATNKIITKSLKFDVRLKGNFVLQNTYLPSSGKRVLRWYK